MCIVGERLSFNTMEAALALKQQGLGENRNEPSKLKDAAWPYGGGDGRFSPEENHL